MQASERQLALCGDIDLLIKHLDNQCWFMAPPSISLPAGASRRPPHTAGTSRARARAHPRASGSERVDIECREIGPLGARGATPSALARPRAVCTHSRCRAPSCPRADPAWQKTASLTPRLLRRDNCAATIPRRRARRRGEKKRGFHLYRRNATYCAATRKGGDLGPGCLKGRSVV
jgi:hypothetical protein